MIADMGQGLVLRGKPEKSERAEKPAMISFHPGEGLEAALDELAEHYRISRSECIRQLLWASIADARKALPKR